VTLTLTPGPTDRSENATDTYRYTQLISTGSAEQKKWWGLKGSEGKTHIRVLLGAKPRKSSNRFLSLSEQL